MVPALDCDLELMELVSTKFTVIPGRVGQPHIRLVTGRLLEGYRPSCKYTC